MTARTLLSTATLALAVSAHQASAEGFQFTFAGPGVSGTVDLTYGTAMDAKDPGAYEATGISGRFSDATLGISNASILGLQPITHATPEPDNHLAPADFSRYAVASGTMDGSLSFDNLFYPAGSPQTADTYPFHGGPFDIYGLLFDIGGGKVVDFWSNGVLPGTNFVDYGVAVATSASALDYVGNGVQVTPEPSTLSLFAVSMIGLLFWKRSALKDLLA